MTAVRDIFPWEIPKASTLETLKPQRVYDRDGHELCTCTRIQKRRGWGLCLRCEEQRVDVYT